MNLNNEALQRDMVEARMAALAAYAIMDTPVEQPFEDVALLAAEVCRTPVALVSFVGRDRQWFKARIGFEPSQTPIRQSVCLHALKQSTPLVIPDLRLDPRTWENTLVTRGPRVRFYAGAPLVTADGVPLGSVCVLDTEPRPEGLSPTQLQSMQALARQVMQLLEARLTLVSRDEELRAEQESGQQAQRTGERLRSATEAGGVGTFELDAPFSEITVSPQVCRIFGLPEAPCYSASTLEALVLPEDRTVHSTATTRRSGSAPLEVEYRIRRASDDRLRWIARRARFERDADGRLVRMYGTVQDITEEKLTALRVSAMLELSDALRAAPSVAEASAATARALGRTMAVGRAGYALVQPPRADLVVTEDWAEAGLETLAGEHDGHCLPATLAHLQTGRPLALADITAMDWPAAEREAYAARGMRALAVMPIMVQGRLEALLFAADRATRAWEEGELAFMRDAAERTYAAMARLRAERDQQIINAEITHRLKNSMAMIQALASHTLRNVPEREPVATFEQRLHALSKAHDVLFRHSTTGTDASIGDVMASALEATGYGERFDITGPDVKIGARPAMSMAMVVHELATNAVKYGALSCEQGRVGVRWEVEGAGETATLVLDWQENGGPPARAPVRRGFGSRLIQAGLVGTGRVELDYAETGFKARMRASLVHMQEP